MTFDFLKQPDIHAGLQQLQETEGAMLLDVREPDEYAQGHIPKSHNLPLSRLEQTAGLLIPDPDTPLFVYCLAGTRSRQAVRLLMELGYTNVQNIGGINAYHGPKEI